jgi:hypothetical protein
MQRPPRQRHARPPMAPHRRCHRPSAAAAAQSSFPAPTRRRRLTAAALAAAAAPPRPGPACRAPIGSAGSAAPQAPTSASAECPCRGMRSQTQCHRTTRRRGVGEGGNEKMTKRANPRRVWWGGEGRRHTHRGALHAGELDAPQPDPVLTYPSHTFTPQPQPRDAHKRQAEQSSPPPPFLIIPNGSGRGRPQHKDTTHRHLPQPLAAVPGPPSTGRRSWASSQALSTRPST